jgi:hypothetical protein
MWLAPTGNRTLAAQPVVHPSERAIRAVLIINHKSHSNLPMKAETWRVHTSAGVRIIGLPPPGDIGRLDASV